MPFSKQLAPFYKDSNKLMNLVHCILSNNVKNGGLYGVQNRISWIDTLHKLPGLGKVYLKLTKLSYVEVLTVLIAICRTLMLIKKVTSSAL